jgi:hypothetical protein
MGVLIPSVVAAPFDSLCRVGKGRLYIENNPFIAIIEITKENETLQTYCLSRFAAVFAHRRLSRTTSWGRAQ